MLHKTHRQKQSFAVYMQPAHPMPQGCAKYKHNGRVPAERQSQRGPAFSLHMVPLGIGETSGSEETGKRINAVGMNTSLHSGLMHPETGQTSEPSQTTTSLHSGSTSAARAMGHCKPGHLTSKQKMQSTRFAFSTPDKRFPQLKRNQTDRSLLVPQVAAKRAKIAFGGPRSSMYLGGGRINSISCRHVTRENIT